MVTVSCECGACTLELLAEPRARVLCHCTICQRFNRAPYADICLFREDEVRAGEGSPIDYQRYKKAMAVDRGACRECGQPVLELLRLPLLPPMAMVPVRMLEQALSLPEPVMHMFYDRRVEEVDDGLPRYRGFLASQLAATRVFLPALLR